MDKHHPAEMSLLKIHLSHREDPQELRLSTLSRIPVVRVIDKINTAIRFRTLCLRSTSKYARSGAYTIIPVVRTFYVWPTCWEEWVAKRVRRPVRWARFKYALRTLPSTTDVVFCATAKKNFTRQVG